MKRIFPIILIAFLLAGCDLLAPVAPTPSDDDMATRVAQILTSMPTATSQIVIQSPTAGLPTVQPTDVLVPVQEATQEPTTAPTEVLVATETPTPTTTATPVNTATPSPNDPVARLGNASWVDDMNNGNNWPTGPDKYTAMEFKDGSMRLAGLSTTDGWRLSWPELTNFYLEMTFQTTDCKASDRYGMFARVPDGTNPDRGYLFGFTCDGQYSLRRWNASIGAKGEMVNLVKWTSSPAIKAGSNQTNKMGLMAVGDRLILYANGQLLNEVNDGTFHKGFFGVFVGAKETDNFTIRVDQVRYWENPSQ
jgi:hypothetical protein